MKLKRQGSIKETAIKDLMVYICEFECLSWGCELVGGLESIWLKTCATDARAWALAFPLKLLYGDMCRNKPCFLD